MKIKKLTIHNIASIEDAEIDFAGGVLGSESLFLICGETGSGKSTILNSISLALYNTAPYLEDVGQQNNGRKIDDMGNNDSRQLMRRGTAEASVKLAFDGNDGNEYVATWEVQRARKKITGKIQDVTHVLSCASKGISVNRRTDVKDLVVQPEVVGLSYEQFCRTTMLAQGQFSKFMKSKKEEKCDILEKLTGTDVYARIGKKVFEKYSEIKQKLDQTKSRIEGAQLMSADERKEKEDKIDKLAESLSNSLKECEQLDAKFQWWKHMEEAEKKREEETGKLTGLKEESNSEEMKQKRSTVVLWNGTVEVRGTMHSAAENANNLASSKKEREKKQEGLKEIVAGLNYLKSVQASLEKEIKDLQDSLKKETAHVGMYEQEQQISTLISVIDQQEKTKAAKQACIKQAEGAKEKLSGAVTEARTQKAAAEKAYQAAQALTTQKIDAAKGVDINALQNAADAAKAHKENVEKAQGAVADYRVKLSLVNNAHKVVEGLEAQKKDAETQKGDAEAKYPAAKQNQEALENQLKGQQSMLDHIAELQNIFHDTETCPLCGSSVQGLHAQNVLNEALAEAKEKASAAKAEADALESQKNAAKTTINLCTKQLKVKNADVDVATTAFNDAESKAKEALNEVDVQLECENLDEVLETKANDAAVKFDAAKANLDNGQAKVNAIEPARLAEDKAHKAFEKADNTLKTQEDEVAKYDNDITVANIAIQDADVLREKTVGELRPLVSIDVDWNAVEFGKLKTEIKNAADQYNARNASLQAKQKERGECAAVITNAQPTVDSLTQKLGGCGDVEAKEMSGFAERLRQFNEEITMLNATIAEQEKRQKSLEESIEAYFSDHSNVERTEVEALLTVKEDEIKNDEKQLRKLDDDITSCNGSLQSIKSDIENSQKQKPEMDEDEISAQVLGEKMSGANDRKAQISKEKVEAETLLKDDDKRILGLQKDVEMRNHQQQEYNQWSILNDAFGGTDGGKFKRIAQSYVLRSLLEKANYYLAKLNQRYELSCTDGYLDISVVDVYQGGVERDVSSLSGGEGFIVSLALALGLSSLNKDKINVDTLFIDEGFGSLSQNCLETVINMLDRLHQMGGRRVGIISHVEVLTTRIPAQISVKRTGPSSSKVEVLLK